MYYGFCRPQQGGIFFGRPERLHDIEGEEIGIVPEYAVIHLGLDE